MSRQLIGPLERRADDNDDDAQTDDGVEIGEWSWGRTYRDGSPFAVKGVIVMGVEDEHIRWARLYMDMVTVDGADIEEVVREAYRPPATG